MGWRRVAEQELDLLGARDAGLPPGLQRGGDRLPPRPQPGRAVAGVLLALVGRARLPPEEWTPVDSLAWLKAMAWDLRGNMHDELDRALASARLEPEQIAELYPPYPYEAAPADRRSADVVGGTSTPSSRPPAPPGATAAPAAGALLQRDAAGTPRAMPLMVGRGDGIGSNAWAVDGERSTTGEPLLANDPHLAPTCPGIWYQMGLHCTEVGDDCPFDVSGFTFAGFPGVVIGHNPRSPGASPTSTPTSPTSTSRRSRATATCAARSGRRSSGATRRSRSSARSRSPSPCAPGHGPLMSDVSRTTPPPAPTPRRRPTPLTAATATPCRSRGPALSPTQTADAVFEINRADDFASSARRRATSPRPARTSCTPTAPATSATRRPASSRSAGRGRPATTRRPGGTSATTGPGASCPSTRSRPCSTPRRGSSRPPTRRWSGRATPTTSATRGTTGYRSQRIVDLLDKKGKLSPADMAADPARHRERRSPRRWCPTCSTSTPAAATTPAASGCCADWDFTQPADSAGGGLLQRGVAQPARGSPSTTSCPRTVAGARGDRWFEVVRRLLDQPNSPWWDDCDTDDVTESRDDILRAGDARRPRRAGPAAVGRADEVALGPPAHARPGEPDRRAVRHRARSRRCSTAGLRAAAAAPRSSTRPAGTPTRATGSSGRRRCGWSSRSATSTRRRWVNLTGASGPRVRRRTTPTRPSSGPRGTRCRWRSPADAVERRGRADRLDRSGRVREPGDARRGRRPPSPAGRGGSAGTSSTQLVVVQQREDGVPTGTRPSARS